MNNLICAECGFKGFQIPLRNRESVFTFKFPDFDFPKEMHPKRLPDCNDKDSHTVIIMRLGYYHS